MERPPFNADGALERNEPSRNDHAQTGAARRRRPTRSEGAQSRRERGPDGLHNLRSIMPIRWAAVSHLAIVGDSFRAVVISGVYELRQRLGAAPCTRRFGKQPEGLLRSLLDGVSRQELYTFRNEGGDVPRIIVMADRATDTVMLSERIGVADLDGEHFRAQLLERLSWAVGDAHAAEQADREE